MDRAAFARALTFLRFHPIAAWSARLSGIAAAILFVALLAVLALFADLMVNRGAVPCFRNLPALERQAFLADVQAMDTDNAAAFHKRLRDDAKELKLGEPWLSLLNKAANEFDVERRRQLIWMLMLPQMVAESVDADAADMVRQTVAHQFQRHETAVAITQDLGDLGLLSLTVRTRQRSSGPVVSLLASWNPWSWSGGNAPYLRGLFAVALLLAAARAGLLFLSSYLAGWAATESVTRLRRALYHQTYRLGILAFRALGPSEAVGISTRHLEAVHEGIFTWLTVVFREPVKFGLLVAFAMFIHFWLALAFVLFALLVWLVGGQIAAYFRRRGRAAEHQAAEQLALLQESLMLLRLVKIYQMEQHNQNRVERQMRRYAEAQLERYSGEAFYRPVFSLLGQLAAIALLFVAGIVVLHGRPGVTSIMVLATSLVCLYWPMVSFLAARRTLRRSRQSAQVLFEFLDRQGSVGQDLEAALLPPLSKSLEFDKVSLQEPGTGRKLLRGVSLAITAGQRVALVGPDEMEKHALVYLLPRFLDPSAGEIRIDKKNLRWVTLDSLRAQIAMVLQHNLVFSDTVANNIGCGDPLYTLPRIIEAAKVAHAHQFIQSLPQGYETVIGDMGHALNQGEMFRIALARAALRDPAVLVIEEPPQPLADDVKALVDDTYSRILTGRTVIFLPHRMSTIRNCDRVFLLFNGKIQAAGDHRDLLSQSELYRHLQYIEFNEFASLQLGVANQVQEPAS